MKRAQIIDIWDVRTFDTELLGELRSYSDLIKSYMDTEIEIFLEREASCHRGIPIENPYGGSYVWLLEHIMDYMKSRVIRAWHYTRLTEPETVRLKASGIHVSTVDALRERLSFLVSLGDFSNEVADALFSASPFNNRKQLTARSGQFWMTSHPIPIDEGGVTPLLSNWGGESVHFWLQDTKLQHLVSKIGKPRVVEVAVPLVRTRKAYAAADGVLGAWGRSLACKPPREAFDLYVEQALGPDSVLKVITEDEAQFAALAKGYPKGFTTAEI